MSSSKPCGRYVRIMRAWIPCERSGYWVMVWMGSRLCTTEVKYACWYVILGLTAFSRKARNHRPAPNAHQHNWCTAFLLMNIICLWEIFWVSCSCKKQTLHKAFVFSFQHDTDVTRCNYWNLSWSRLRHNILTARNWILSLCPPYCFKPLWSTMRCDICLLMWHFGPHGYVS